MVQTKPATNRLPEFTEEMRDHLYEVGQKVWSMMASPDTPNEVKLKKGVAGVLYEEWRKGFEKKFPSVDLSDVTEACSKALNLRLAYAQDFVVLDF